MIRILPNEKEDVYLILSAEYSPGRHSIPPHFSLQLRKTTAVQSVPSKHTTVNIQNALNELVQHIDNSTAPPEQKAEAKSRLAGFLADPVKSLVLGESSVASSVALPLSTSFDTDA